MNNVSAEVTPSITLRKGNTEIKIKDPTKLIRKIEEMFPKGVNKNLHSELIARELTQKKIEYGVGQDAIDDDPLVVIPNDLPESFPPNPSSEIRTVNKNAYEIRESILQNAISVVESTSDTNNDDIKSKVDKILQTAHKFYEFVENRR